MANNVSVKSTCHAGFVASRPMTSVLTPFGGKSIEVNMPLLCINSQVLFAKALQKYPMNMISWSARVNVILRIFWF